MLKLHQESRQVENRYIRKRPRIRIWRASSRTHDNDTTGEKGIRNWLTKMAKYTDDVETVKESVLKKKTTIARTKNLSRFKIKRKKAGKTTESTDDAEKTTELLLRVEVTTKVTTKQRQLCNDKNDDKMKRMKNEEAVNVDPFNYVEESSSIMKE